MKPLKLQMQAFGPYAKNEIIDFTKLGNRNMFVISGKTGAGKTTIFDGISFAIYGKASGDDRAGQDLRSHFADEEMLTEVSLTFQLRDKIYFIKRSPKQERKKKNGEGYTEVNAKAELYVETANGRQVLGANIKEVDEKIRQIIGLDATQFKQILMIPQGDFKKLLISESKEKEIILQKLFHTEIYKRIEEKLKEEATAVKEEDKKLRLELETYINDIRCPETEIIPEDNEQTYKPPAQIVEELETAINIEKEKSRVFTEELTRLTATEKELQGQLFHAKDIVGKFEELNRLKLEKTTIENKRATIELFEVQLKNARKASMLDKQEQTYIRIGKKVKELTASIEKMRFQHQELLEKMSGIKQAYEEELAKTDDREAAAKKVIALQELKNDVLQFDSFKQEVFAAKKESDLLYATHEQMERELESVEQRLQSTEEQIVEGQKATIAHSEKSRELDRQTELGKLVEEFIDQMKEAAACEQKFLDAEVDFKKKLELYKQLQEQFKELERTYMQSHASRLALALQEGESCPVCGSASHPNPATFHSTTVSEEEMEVKKKQLVTAEQERLESEQLHFKTKIKWEAAQESARKQESKLQDMIPDYNERSTEVIVSELKINRNKLSDEVNLLAEKVNQVSSMEQTRSQLRERVNILKTQLKEQKSKMDSSKEAYIGKQTRLADMEKRLPEHLRTQAEYERAFKSAIDQKQQLENTLNVKREALQHAKQEEARLTSAIDTNNDSLTSMQTELAQERLQFKTEMERQGFATYQLYMEAKKTEEQIQELENDIEHFRKEEQRVESLLQNLAFTLKGIEFPDMEVIEQKISKNAEEIKHKRELISALDHLIQHNAGISVKIKGTISKQLEIQVQYENIGHLFELSKGNNPFRITFERFVLAAFLDDILKEANGRLKKMTSGRYQLMRKVDPTRRNVQSGLELTVFDQFTGMERHVKTLSGGESFKASLSLALGLAAVVQQNAGGISLETMFIDEGFGTLDPESLDQAVESLLEIQSSGRLVGIISHVPELKERIDARLEVIGRQNGSTTQFIVS